MLDENESEDNFENILEIVDRNINNALDEVSDEFVGQVAIIMAERAIDIAVDYIDTPLIISFLKEMIFVLEHNNTEPNDIDIGSELDHDGC